MRPQFKFKQKPVEPVSRFIDPHKTPATYSKSEKHFLGLKHFIFRYKFAFLGVMLAVIMLFYYLYSLTNTYKSEVTISFNGFEIPEYSENVDASIPGFASMRDGFPRIYNIVYSKEMYDHLIKKFNLYDHFGLDPAETSSYPLLRQIIKSNITLLQVASRALTIQVTDQISGIMSANIANEIALQANVMNKKYITEKIENRVQVYAKLHEEIKSQTESDIVSINHGIEQLNGVLSKSESANIEVEKLLYSLNNLSKKVEDDLGQLIRINNMNSWTLNSMQEDVMSNVQILQDALPGEYERNLSKWQLISLGLIATFFVTLLLFNIAYTYRNYLHLLKA